jgi:hypothetical protein
MTVEYEFHYSRYPALRSYIDRVDAEQVNFKRFVIKQHRDHYYSEKVVITIVDGCEIKCSDKEYAPTEEEEAASGRRPPQRSRDCESRKSRPVKQETQEYQAQIELDVSLRGVRKLRGCPI